MDLDNTFPFRAPNTCTCGTCPVHGSQIPRCPACGAVGAHFCPGPSTPGTAPRWYSDSTNLKFCTQCKNHYSGDAHICQRVSGTVYVQRDTSTATG